VLCRGAQRDGLLSRTALTDEPTNQQQGAIASVRSSPAGASDGHSHGLGRPVHPVHPASSQSLSDGHLEGSGPPNLAKRAAARATAKALLGCHATCYPDESHDTYSRHLPELLTALISSMERGQNDHKTGVSLQM
jgi:hypothetical protein